MSDVVTLAKRVSNVEVSPQFNNYSKVIIHVSDETIYEAGNDTGRVVEIDNPFGTQEMADDMLAALTGYQYQPYEADGALLDPAAEIGDAASMRGVYGGIYTRSREFNRLMKADISAPSDEEINHEYAYESQEQRQFTRAINSVKASLIIANDRIDASVAQTGGEQSSFGWSLTSNAHRWYANGQEVMSVTASGLTVKGNVQATTGNIGGFTISASAIYNNISEFGGTQSQGVYVGTNGIQLGQNFKVDTMGNTTLNSLTANNATINGTLMVGGSAITAANLRLGATRANGGYSTWNGTSTAWSNATRQNTNTYPGYFTCGYIFANRYYLGGRAMAIQDVSVRRADGNTQTLHFLGFGS